MCRASGFRRSEGKRHLVDRLKWDHMRMNLKEIGCENVAWLQTAQNMIHWWRLVGIVMNLLVL